MSNDSRKILATRTAIAALLALPTAALAITVQTPTDSAAAKESATVRVESGRVSSADIARGILVVDGRTYRISAAETSFSDDRPKPSPDGIRSLRTGDRVQFSSIEVNGVRQIKQLVVKE